MMKPVPAACTTCSRWLLWLLWLLARLRLSEEALEQVVRPAAAAEEVAQVLGALPRLGPDVDDSRGDRLRDVAECRGGQRPVIGALFIGGAAVWAADGADIPNREATTMPTASDAIAISRA